ncbi:MAG TPA: hypothetical protein VGL65_13660 [Gemmatimonadales bacterium]|jgi:hypothetical protein
MSGRLRIVGIAGALLLGTVAVASAQTSHAHIGVHGLYNTTFDDWGIGAQFSAPVARHLEFYPSFDYYFESAGTMWEANADVKYRAIGQRYDWIYFGTGINLHYQNIDDDHLTQAGWNLIMGAESLRGQIHPFAEMRVTVTDHTRFQMQAGLNVTLAKE